MRPLAGICAINAIKTYCKQGHLLVGDNVYHRPSSRPGRECRTCNRLRERSHRRRNPEAVTARAMLGYARRLGEIEPALECENCKAEGELEAHHHNGYKRENWLDVQWLCIPCHVTVH